MRLAHPGARPRRLGHAPGRLGHAAARPTGPCRSPAASQTGAQGARVLPAEGVVGPGVGAPVPMMERIQSMLLATLE